MQGKVKWFSAEKGYGFIEREDAGVDILCIDSSDGFSEWQSETLSFIKGKYVINPKTGQHSYIAGLIPNHNA